MNDEETLNEEQVSEVLDEVAEDEPEQDKSPAEDSVADKPGQQGREHQPADESEGELKKPGLRAAGKQQPRYTQPGTNNQSRKIIGE